MKSNQVQIIGLVGLAFLYAACAGKVHNLGDEGSAGAGSDAGGKDGGKTTAKGGAGGKSATTAKGGTGGKSATTDTKVGRIAYPLDPTLPVDPKCSCPTSNQICNAAGKCVERCEPGGVCATWLTDRSVTAMYAEGSTLYYATGPTTDPVGNPIKNGSLFRVEYPSGTPTQIATGLTKARSIVGRYGAATYVTVDGSTGGIQIIRVSDSGDVKPVVESMSLFSMRDKWLAYTSYDRKSLLVLELDGSSAPTTLVTLPPGGDNNWPKLDNVEVLKSTIMYETYETSLEVCNINLADLSPPPKCVPALTMSALYRPTVGTSGDELYVSWAGGFRVETLRSDLTHVRYLADSSTTPSITGYNYGTKLYGGWLYTWLGPFGSSSVTTGRLLRYPTAVGRLPQTVVPEEIASKSVVSKDTTQNVDPSYMGPDIFAVNSAGVFWVQHTTDPNQGQYIFHAPLPPQPCDAELLCANTAEVCTNGFCAAPK
jgi:hypothetical protein